MENYLKFINNNNNKEYEKGNVTNNNFIDFYQSKSSKKIVNNFNENSDVRIYWAQ